MRRCTRLADDFSKKVEPSGCDLASLHALQLRPAPHDHPRPRDSARGSPRPWPTGVTDLTSVRVGDRCTARLIDMSRKWGWTGLQEGKLVFEPPDRGTPVSRP